MALKRKKIRIKKNNKNLIKQHQLKKRSLLMKKIMSKVNKVQGKMKSPN